MVIYSHKNTRDNYSIKDLDEPVSGDFEIILSASINSEGNLAGRIIFYPTYLIDISEKLAVKNNHKIKSPLLAKEYQVLFDGFISINNIDALKNKIKDFQSETQNEDKLHLFSSLSEAVSSEKLPTIQMEALPISYSVSFIIKSDGFCFLKIDNNLNLKFNGKELKAEISRVIEIAYKHLKYSFHRAKHHGNEEDSTILPVKYEDNFSEKIISQVLKRIVELKRGYYEGSSINNVSFLKGYLSYYEALINATVDNQRALELGNNKTNISKHAYCAQETVESQKKNIIPFRESVSALALKVEDRKKIFEDNVTSRKLLFSSIFSLVSFFFIIYLQKNSEAFVEIQLFLKASIVGLIAVWVKYFSTRFVSYYYSNSFKSFYGTTHKEERNRTTRIFSLNILIRIIDSIPVLNKLPKITMRILTFLYLCFRLKTFDFRIYSTEMPLSNADKIAVRKIYDFISWYSKFVTVSLSLLLIFYYLYTLDIWIESPKPQTFWSKCMTTLFNTTTN